jgi:hypothetical protein
LEFTFRIKYDSGVKDFDGLDMYYGSKSLAAISEFLLLSIHASLKEEIILKAPSAKGFKLVMERASIGSYDQIIQLIITDANTVSLMTDLGKNALYDLLKYMLCSLLGIPVSFILNRKAKKKLNAIMQQNEDLLQRLENALMAAHLPVKHQGYSTAMLLGRTPIITFDENTLSYLETELVDPETEIISVAISRFNARTGTGRFIKDINSISHGFSPLDNLSDYEKLIMADNLGKVARNVFEPLNAIVTKVTSKDGRLKRYQLHGISDA